MATLVLNGTNMTVDNWRDDKAKPAMTKDEYFAAVLLQVGNPDKRMAEFSAAVSYQASVVDAMIKLAPQGPREALGYVDFLNWCKEQKDDR